LDSAKSGSRWQAVGHSPPHHSREMRKQIPGSSFALSDLDAECLVERSAPRPGGGTKESAPISPKADIDKKRDERSLVFAAQAGDSEAVRALYDEFRDRVWKILLYSLGDPQQVQDVFQSVFFKFFRGLSGFRFQSSLITWLYRIARNECLNYRRRHRLPAIPLENIIGSRDEIDIRAGTDAVDARWEREHVLMRAVRQLPPKMRDVVLLKYIEDLSYEEIGRALGCASGTVASRLNRALTELGERLGPFRRWL
jgi:RNA polymerase sigma-70 factor (ECF subfamily)